MPELTFSFIPACDVVAGSAFADVAAVSSTDAKGIVSKFVYDRAGNVTQQSVGNELTSFTYTDNGLIETVKRGSDITQYSYNNLNQIIKKVLQDGTKIEYTYIRFCCQCLRYIQGFCVCI